MRLLLCCLLTIIIRRKEKGLDGEKSIVMMKRRKVFKRVSGNTIQARIPVIRLF